MKKSILLAATLLLSVFAFGQQVEKPYIEVTGTAKMEVIPNQIYLRIVLQERNESRGKVTIDRLESDMKGALKRAGIDTKDLSLLDAAGDLTQITRRKQDVLTTKSYQLMVTSASELSKVVEELGKVEVKDVAITRVSHSDMENLRKEIRIKAIKAAKEKADYLLDALGEKAGMPLIITENSWMENNEPRLLYRMDKESNTIVSRGEDEGDEDLSFTKIRLQASFTARFEILAK